MKIPVSFGGGGSGSDDCTAKASQVLSPYTAITSDSEDEPAYGTMQDYAGTTQSATSSLDTSNQRLQLTIPNDGRYTTGSKLYQTYSNVRSLIGYTDASKVLSGTTFLGLAGTMTDKSGSSTAATSSVSGSNVRLQIPTNGYYNTSAYLTNSFTNMASTIGLTAAKIKYGETILGITGTWQGWVATSTDLYYNGSVGTLGGSVSLYTANGASAKSDTNCVVLDTTSGTGSGYEAAMGFSTAVSCSPYSKFEITYNITKAPSGVAYLYFGVYSSRPTSVSAFNTSNATKYMAMSYSGGYLSTGSHTYTMDISDISSSLYVGISCYGNTSADSCKFTAEITRVRVTT